MTHLLLLGALAKALATPTSVPTLHMDFVGVSPLDLVHWAARYYDVAFILGDTSALQTRTIEIHTVRPISYAEGWQLFVSALHDSGFAVVRSGHFARVVLIADVAAQPLDVYLRPPRLDDSVLTVTPIRERLPTRGSNLTL